MRKIIFVFLFFCFAITTVLAQVATIDIAAPDSNGLSDNQVEDFDVDTDGTILNNSAVDGTAQLRGTDGTSTDVTANTNITAAGGSEASLILFQVTSPSNTSDLDGAIEVFGGEAGLIIANPNGITCNGCGFVNASRVDLVTGNYNTDTGTFDNISNDITVTSFGLDASSVGILNIQTNNFTNNGVVSTDTFNLSIAGIFNNNNTESEIDVNTFNLSAAGDFDYTIKIIRINTSLISTNCKTVVRTPNKIICITISKTSISINGPSSSNIYNAILSVTICNNISGSRYCKSIICIPNEIITTVVAVEITSYIEVEAISSINSSCISIIKITSCNYQKD